MSPAPLPLRTRVFAAAMRVLAAEPSDASQMVALRAKRQRLLTTRAGAAVFGTDDRRVDVEESEVEIDGRTVRLRLHRPTGATGPLPVIVAFHGGGWCLGSPEQTRWLNSRIAAHVGAIVVAPTYRLAPEHPYPAAVDDAWATLRWVADQAAELGGDPARLSVMGDSAGGNLAAVCALLARDAGGPALRSQVLIYPAVEAHERWPSEDEHAEAPVLTSALMRRFIALYLGDDATTEDWQASPIRAGSLSGLPPALILTAGHDPLRDHGSKYAQALRSAGVRAVLVDYPDAIHGFASLPGVAPAAEAALRDMVMFLRTTV